jgi:hypothetical protein
MEFFVDDRGVLRRPNLHDGLLLAVEVPQRGLAYLKMQSISGQPFVLEMTGVDRLLCDGFAEGNIISEVLVVSGQEPVAATLRRLLGSLHASVQEPYLSRHEAFVEGVRQSIADGQRTLIEVVPSYGGEVFAVCADFRITEKS